MKFTFDEIDQLAVLLEAEMAGRDFDPDEARILALRLAELCPEIGDTMRQVARRLTVAVREDVACQT